MPASFEKSELAELYQTRRDQNRDLKAIITARDSATGTGKTTLAVRLCKRWDINGWSADKATLDPSEFSELYDELPEGSAILLDEAEQAADNRRSLSHENVELSHDLATKRYRQIFSVFTLPSVSMLDKRVKELADVRINVIRRGHAKVYKEKIDDFTGQIFEQHICNLEWDALNDDDDYHAVEDMKAARMERRQDSHDDPDDTLDPDELRREGRNEVIRTLCSDGYTQSEIAESLEMDQSTLSRIMNGNS